MKWAAILLMAGSSERFKDEIPKQFHLLYGRPLFLFPLKTLLSFREFSKIYLVVQKSWIKQTSTWIDSLRDDRIEIISGGSSRQESSYKAIKKANFDKVDYVLIHDAARPLVSKKIIEENLSKTPSFSALDTCIRATDTLVMSKQGYTIDAIPNRNHMYQGQTPQSFKTSLILKAHEIAIKSDIDTSSDDCSLVLNLGHEVGIVEGDKSNFKITTPQDLLLAERLLPYLADAKECHKESLKGKKYVVCGATGDIGGAIAKLLEKEGAKVIGLSKSSKWGIDLGDRAQVEIVFDKIYREFGEIDGLILSAGLLHAKPYKDLSLDEIERSISANLMSYLYPIKYAKIKSGGHILALSSSSYLKGRGGISLYAALKALVANFIQGLAEETPDLFINAIAPCRCKGRMRKEAFPSEEESYLLDPLDIGKKSLEILRSNFTGLVVDIKKETPPLTKEEVSSSKEETLVQTSTF